MTEYTNTIPAPVVHIADTDIQQITYEGAAVVTFAQIDQVHGRPSGTAARNFRENRERFVEGDDFIELTSDEIRRMSDGAFPPRTARGTLITRRGYLKLVKPMTDDRSWEVQGEMIERYFAIERIAQVMTAIAPAMAREARLQYRMFADIAKAIGLAGNQLVMSANRATKITTGVDIMGAMGITHIDAKVNEPDINVSSIGARLGMSARKVNELLVQYGYQLPFRDHKARVYYELTDKGEQAGGVFKDTGKKHGSGTPVTQLMWADGIVAQLQAEMGNVAA